MLAEANQASAVLYFNLCFSKISLLRKHATQFCLNVVLGNFVMSSLLGRNTGATFTG